MSCLFSHHDNVDVKVVFCIGSNCSHREEEVAAGIEWLSSIISEAKSSCIYATPDCLGSESVYYNAVVKGHSTLNAENLEALCKKYEASRGRSRELSTTGIVPVDIDLVIYDGEVRRPRDARQQFFQIGYGMI